MTPPVGVGAGVGAVVGAGVPAVAGAGVSAGAADGCATPGTGEAEPAGGVSPGVAAPAVPAESEPDAITADAKIPAVIKGMRRLVVFRRCGDMPTPRAALLSLLTLSHTNG
ncbi:hypothetical protein GCM10009646_79500 [Streptomyces aureus]